MTSSFQTRKCEKNPFEEELLDVYLIFTCLTVKPKAVDDSKDAISEDRKSAITSHVTAFK
ncbi:hypothetical protein R3I94_002470 [Phoxinus phoxinus]